MNTKKTALCLGLLAVSAASQAVVLTPDNWTALPGNTAPSGTVIVDELVPFSLGDMSGFVQNRVVRKPDQGLVFVWRLAREDRSSSSLMKMFRLGDFHTSVYDADYSNTSIGTHPVNFAYLFSGGGGDVNWLFTDTTGGAGGLEENTSSRIFYLDTDERRYAKTAQYDLVGHDGSNWLYSQQFATYAPVPEPASLLVLGLGATALLRRKRKA